MSVINLPKDILICIFKQLTRNNIKECSKVCKSWYSAANVVLLENVVIHNRSAVMKFLQFCKEESKTMRLNSIKTLAVGDFHQEALSRQEIGDFIAHLPSRLNTLHFNDLLIPVEELLSEDLCNVIVSQCKQLRFLEPHTHKEPDLCLNLFWKLRHVLTKLSLKENSDPLFEEYGGFVDYFCGFPQLKELSVNTFRATWEMKMLLSLFERLSDLRVLKAHFDTRVPDNAVKNYLETKTQDEQNQLFGRFGKLEKFSVTAVHNSKDLVNFATEYLTGLKYFSLMLYDKGDWKSSLVHNKLLDFVCTLKSFYILIGSVMPNDIEEDFATIANKIYHQMNDNVTCVDRVFTLFLPSREDGAYHMWSEDDHEEERNDRIQFELLLNSVSLGENTIKRSMQLQLGIEDPISDDLVFDNVNTLGIISETTSDRNDPLEIFYITDKLDQMPAVTKVILDVPMDKERHFPEDLETKSYPLVSCLEYRYYRPGALAGLADCLPLFPNLISLEIHYLIGVYGESLVREPPGYYYRLVNYNEKESHIRLENLAVNTLRLNFSSEGNSEPEKFFVINVHCLRNDNQQLYVTPNQSLQVTKVNEEEVAALTNGKECVRVFMTVEYIKNFVLVMEDNRERIDVEVSFNLFKEAHAVSTPSHHEIIILYYNKNYEYIDQQNSGQ